ncbi:MAG: hypothetical protein PUA97_02895 [bacterium]|nr:hypothetical protein [bacterium]
MTDLMQNEIVDRTIRTIFATLDSVFFFILRGVYQVFFNVSTAEILSNELIRDFYYRCQLVIGVFMLFKLSVTILEGIMDPARITDKKAGAGKIISRIITSLVILALITPINIPNPQNEWEKQVNNNGLLFGALYSLQERILSNNTIGKLVLGTADGIDDATAQGQTLAEDADEFAVNILRGFLRINVKQDSQVETGKDPEVNRDNWICSDIPDDQIKTIQTGPTEEMLKLVNEDCSAGFRFAYLPLIGGIVALVISVVLILYTIDVAIRALKLAILRLIAPIPIISHMSISAKEGKGEDAFSSWVRSLTSTYLELFIRLAIMYFVIYLIHDIIENGIVINTGTGIVGILSFIFIVIGIFIFARMAPRFIENSLGIKGMGGSIGLAMGLSAAGALRQAGTLGEAFEAMRRTTGANIDNYNAGKGLLPLGGPGGAYNSGRDHVARILTGDPKMTAREMAYGERHLNAMGINPTSLKQNKEDFLNAQNEMNRRENMIKRGWDKLTSQEQNDVEAWYRTKYGRQLSNEEREQGIYQYYDEARIDAKSKQDDFEDRKSMAKVYGGARSYEAKYEGPKDKNGRVVGGRGNRAAIGGRYATDNVNVSQRQRYRAQGSGADSTRRAFGNGPGPGPGPGPGGPGGPPPGP